MRLAAKVGIIICIIIALIIAAGAALLYTTINTMEEQMGIFSREDLERMALTDVDHVDLIENNAAYMGQVIKGTGHVVGIEDLPLGGSGYVIDAGKNRYYLMYDPQIQDAEMDYAMFYGTVAGLDVLELASGDSVPAVVLNHEDIIFSTTPFN